MSGARIGEVTHYFDRIGVVVLKLTNTLQVGDHVHILGRSTDFQQEVTSLQIEHKPVNNVGAGQEVAMKVVRPVRPPAAVFKIDAEEIA